MNERRAELLGECEIEIKVKGTKYGHREPWQNGTVVTFADHLSVVGGQGYRRLGISDGNDDRWVKLPHKTVGIVTDYAYALEEFWSQVDVVGGQLKDKLVHQWYWVAFNDELLWVRCDWLKLFE